MQHTANRPTATPIRVEREATGVARLLTTVAWASMMLAVVIGVLGWRFVDQIEESAQASLILTEEALDSIDATITAARSTAETMAGGIRTAEQSLGDASGTLESIGSLFGEAGDIASGDLPDSVASIRSALPPLIESTTALNQTLETLQFFGIDVVAAEPLSAPLQEMDRDLTELESRLRDQEAVFADVESDFSGFAESSTSLATTLAEVRADLAASSVLLDAYASTAEAADASVAQTRADVERSAATARWLIVAVGVLFALAQAGPLAMARALRG